MSFCVSGGSGSSFAGLMAAQHPHPHPFKQNILKLANPWKILSAFRFFSKSALNWQNAFDFSPRTMTGINYVTTLLFKLNVYISARNTVYYCDRDIYHYCY